MPTIPEVAKQAGSFKTLLTAVRAAGLEETLKGEGPFTCFAPTDDAFKKLPPGQVDKLLKDKEELTRILTYHVAAGKHMSPDVAKMSQIKTLQGGSISVESREGVRLNKARVVQADVRADNGVIHAIDTVLMPPRG